MGRGTVLPLVLLVACGVPMDNSWTGDEDFSSGINAWYLDYPESDRSQLASAIDLEASGFSLSDGHATVHMADMTCGVHVDTGTVTFDLDFREGEIQDGLDKVGGDPVLTSLLVAPPMVNLIPLSNPALTSNYLVHGVREARLLDGTDFVALAATEQGGDCQLRTYRRGQLEGAVDLPATCNGVVDLAVDRLTGQSWIAGPDGVFSVDGADVRQLDIQGDLVAFDPTSEQLYVAQRGLDTVYALDAAGLTWAKTLPGAVVDLDDGGLAGGLAIAHEVGRAHAIVRMSATGAQLDSLIFDEPVFDVEVSDGGDLMAVARLNDHGYYRID